MASEHLARNQPAASDCSAFPNLTTSLIPFSDRVFERVEGDVHERRTRAVGVPRRAHRRPAGNPIHFQIF